MTGTRGDHNDNDQMIMIMMMMFRWVMSTLTKEPDTHRMTLEQVAEKSEVNG